ncbi:MAG: serine/threonine-protein phosphatase, partial [Cytophagales bacterium]|nr:serine/threonine-protein phosphatase [Armatimonadota bacterium]
GQEPALLRRRADGTVEQLPPTGPILGAIETARYGEAVLPLEPGDAFTMYTDGITEAGPNRRELFGVERVIALMKEDVESAESLKTRLVRSVEEYTGGVYNDDICLLVGVVKEAMHRSWANTLEQTVKVQESSWQRGEHYRAMSAQK